MEAAARRPSRKGQMIIRQVAALGLLGVALAGCRNDPSISLLERDNFRKEQRIYQLENRVRELEEALEDACPPPGTTVSPDREDMSARPAAEPRTQTVPGGSGGAPPFRAPSSKPDAGPAVPPIQISPGVEMPGGGVPDTLKAPGTNDPAQKIPPPGAAVPDGQPSGRSSSWIPAPRTPATPANSRAVAQVTLHPTLTGGLGSGRARDDGLLVVVEPRDLAGNIVEAPGDVSVALLDPAQSGEQARLARWDFTAAETEQMIHSGAQPGIHLRLPLTAGPSHDRLKLYVRYTTRDGLKFQAEQAIVLALNSRRPSGEAPSSAAERPAQQMAERPARPQWSPMR